jgi:hypothetical protein
MAEELLQIRVTADFKEAEGAFLRLAKVATSFESTIRTIAGTLNKDFNRINGMAELFGDTSNVVKDKMEALKRAMSSLMTNGFQALNPEVQKLKKQYDELASSLTPIPVKLDQAGDSLKKSNQKWTNFALVIQDLPYGFRGIQNNLPALMGGIAGLAGPFYFVGSAIIALFTAWDQGSFTAKNAIDRVTEAHKKSTDVVTKGADAQSEALVEMSKMSTIFSGVKDGVISAKDALQEYNTTYGETWGIAKNVNEAEDSFIKKSNAYVQAMALRAMANEKYAQAQDAFRRGELARGEDQTSFLQKFAAGLDALDQVGIMGFDVASLTKWSKAFSKNYAETQKVLVNDIINESASSFEMLMSQGRENDKRANKKLSDAGIKVTTSKGKKGKTTEELTKEQIAKEKAANDAQTKAYIDTLDERGKKEYQVGLDLANELTTMKAAGFSDSTTYYSAFRANMDKIAKEYDDKEYKRNQDSINANIAAETKFYQDSMRIWSQNQKEKADGQAKYTKDYVSSLELQLKTELKLHKNSVTLMQEDIKNKIKQLEAARVFAIGNKESTATIDKAINDLKAQLTGLGSVSTAIQGILNSTITQGFEALGESIGNLVLTGKLDFSSLGNILADALIQIGKALIMYSALVKAAKEALEKGKFKAGLVIGVLAVAAGIALKGALNKKKDTGGATPFASGGIVSGPTMGLIGEYPGAKSNPEVVAPLDKLKDMLGGNGGGSFVLRGTDLVLALNRSETSLNLRRGS